MNSCEVMQAQAKHMKSTCSTACGSGSVHVRFQGTKKRLEKSKELNDLFSNMVREVLKENNCAKSTSTHDSGSEEDMENFNFENISIGEE